ncbi:hypothetical protein P8452_52311 [Trifolium repens]|nr:hypothetical protein P8452_52311 [Trifolium repens]
MSSNTATNFPKEIASETTPEVQSFAPQPHATMDEDKQVSAGTDHVTGETEKADVAQENPEKVDVGPDDGTSLDQLNKQDDIADAMTDIDSGFETAKEDEHHSETISDKTDTNLGRDVISDTETKSPEKRKTVVDLEEEDSFEVPLAKTYGLSIAKRLRSSKGKSVPTAAKTHKTRRKNVAVGPSRSKSKVIPKVPSGSKSRKRKAVEFSDSEFEDVEEDVPNISASVTKKSTVKKGPPNVKDVATDKISFHYPESRTRSSFIVVLITTSSCCAITTLSSLRVGGGFWRRGAGSIGRALVQRSLWACGHYNTKGTCIKVIEREANAISSEKNTVKEQKRKGKREKIELLPNHHTLNHSMACAVPSIYSFRRQNTSLIINW